MESKRLTLEELGELNAYFGEHGELPHGVEEALLEMAVGYHELRAIAASSAATDLQKHQDLVEALQWLPMSAVVEFYDLDDFLEEMREPPNRWLPERECDHTGEYARCIKCRNGEG